MANGGRREFFRSYPVSFGTWFAWNPMDGTTGDGAFGVNSRFHPGSFTDRLSITLGVAEVKTHQALLHDGGAPNALNVPPPETPAEAVAYGGTFSPDLVHSVWVNGMLVQTGLTTAFTPNTPVIYLNGSTLVDADFISMRLEIDAANLSYATITARSYHTGIVNGLLMDGSVRSVSNSVDRGVWRALGTRAISEALGEF